MEKGKGFGTSSPMGEKDTQYEPEILIIPLRPSLEATAQVETLSPLKQAPSPSNNEFIQKAMSPNSPTSPANGQPSRSIKHLQSLFERDNLPLTAPVIPGKKSSLSSPGGQHTNSLKELQSLFETEPISKNVFAVASSGKTTASPVNIENSNWVKDEGKNVPPQLVPLSASGKTTKSPVNGEYNYSLRDERETISQQTSIKSSLNGEPAISVKQLQSLFNREQGPQPVIISSSTKARTSLVNGEQAFLSHDEREDAPKVIFVISSNQTTPFMNGDETSSLEHEGRQVPLLDAVTLSDRPTTLPVKREHTDFLKEIQSLNKREQETLLTPLSSSDASPTSTMSVELVGSSKEIQSPHQGQLPLNLPHSPLKPELILELKKGKVLKPTQHTKRLTTVFSGNSKHNRRLSIERAESTVSSPESDGPQPLSPSQYAPDGHTPAVFPSNFAT